MLWKVWVQPSALCLWLFCEHDINCWVELDRLADSWTRGLAPYRWCDKLYLLPYGLARLMSTLSLLGLRPVILVQVAKLVWGQGMLEVLALDMDWPREVHYMLSLNTSLVSPLALPFAQSQAIYLQQYTLCHRATHTRTHILTHTTQNHFTIHPDGVHTPTLWLNRMMKKLACRWKN